MESINFLDEIPFESAVRSNEKWENEPEGATLSSQSEWNCNEKSLILWKNNFSIIRIDWDEDEIAFVR